MIRIGDLAARAGVSTRALRYYGEQGLLPAVRSVGGQRQYPDSAVERVRLIRQLYAAGLPSHAIAELLPCVDAKKATPEALALMRTQRDAIDRQVKDLIATRDRLDQVIVVATTPNACTTTQGSPGPADNLT